MTLTVHHLEHARSQRVLWLLEALGLACETQRYARDPKTMPAPPELRAVHPLGKGPVITDGGITGANRARSSSTCWTPTTTRAACACRPARPSAAAHTTGWTSPRAAPCRRC
jgi:hypothetical protein